MQRRRLATFTAIAYGVARHRLGTGRRSRTAGANQDRRGRFNRALGLFCGLFCVWIVVVWTAGTLHYHSLAAKSSDVQHHGIAAGAVVGRVFRSTSCEAGEGCSSITVIHVRLDSPVQGRSTAKVEYQDDVHGFTEGQAVQIRIGRHDLEYAEIAGSPVETNVRWRAWGGSEIVVLLLGVGLALALWRQRRRR